MLYTKDKCSFVTIWKLFGHLTPKSAKPCFIIVPGAFQSSLFAAAFCGRSTLCPSLMEEGHKVLRPQKRLRGDYFPSDSQQNLWQSISAMSSYFVIVFPPHTPPGIRACIHSLFQLFFQALLHQFIQFHLFMHSFIHSCIHVFKHIDAPSFVE